MSLQEHLDFLHEKIYQTKTKWPHFAGLINEVQEIANDLKPDSNAAILERAYMYGGISLLKPLFSKGNVISVDCQTLTAKERGGFQAHWTIDPRCIRIESDYKAPITDSRIDSDSQDYILIPNVLHHERDQDAMFKEFYRILKPGGKGYIFEALIRELHQAPDDYVRYTPWGFDYMLEKAGLKMNKFTPIGGPFEVITYCWVQALQFIPEEERQSYEKQFYEVEFPKLLEMDKKYPKNLFREHTSFPLGYGIYFEKPIN